MKTKIKFKKWQVEHIIENLYKRLDESNNKKEKKKINRLLDKFEYVKD
jgi:hypothetical protein